MGIRPRLVLIVGVVSLLATVLIGLASYKFSELAAMREARSKSQIILDYVYAGREYFKKVQRPLILELVEKERFYPDLMSGFAISRGMWEEFHGKMAGYEFKQATLDPLYAVNKADPMEAELIDKFSKNEGIAVKEGIVERQGQKYFYLAKPIKVDSKGCLACHGLPLDAPKDQVEIYGTEHGYNWKLGEVISSYIVYVSVQEALQNAKRTAGMIFIVSIAGFLVVIMTIWLLFERSLDEDSIAPREDGL